MAQKTFVAGDVLTASDTNLYLMHEGGAWSSWTPTWTNLTLGNGTVTAKYARASRLINFSLKLTFGSTTAVTGAIRFTPPVAAATGDEYSSLVATLLDASGSRYLGIGAFVSTTVCEITAVATGTYATQVVTSATVPFTWTTSDQIYVTGTYESLA